MTNTKKLAKLRQSPPRSTDDLLERVRALGCEVESGKHWRVIFEGHLVAVLAKTASCSRGVLNDTSSLRGAGVDVKKMTIDRAKLGARLAA